MCLLSQLDRMGLGRKGAALLTWIKQEVKGKRRNESKMFIGHRKLRFLFIIHNNNNIILLCSKCLIACFELRCKYGAIQKNPVLLI